MGLASCCRRHAWDYSAHHRYFGGVGDCPTAGFRAATNGRHASSEHSLKRLSRTRQQRRPGIAIANPIEGTICAGARSYLHLNTIWVLIAQALCTARAWGLLVLIIFAAVWPLGPGRSPRCA
jgi:hypothetical protein